MSTVAIIGGGLSGLAAAAAAVEQGLRVQLFEQSRFLGGRAGSFVDPVASRPVDFCRHVAMGCCTEFLDFCCHTGVEDCFVCRRTIHFIAPDGSPCNFAPSRWLPAPLHLLPGLLRLRYLTWGERWGIARTMRRLVLETRGPAAFGEWLREQCQSSQAVERFWSVVLTSALSETIEHIATDAARQVFRDGFWSSRNACHLIEPRRPLVEIFHGRVGRWLADHGVQIHLGAAVQGVEGRHRVEGVVLGNGSRHPCDGAIVAVPWHRLRRLLSGNFAAAAPDAVEHLQPAAITAVHLWFDRPAVPLSHAALVGRLGQWVFAEPFGDGGQYCQVVVSASHRMPRRSREDWVSEIRGELASIWPGVREAGLLHSRVVTRPTAAFSMGPGANDFRPPQQTSIANLTLAGDWTATGWPGTMESAVRSGRAAAASLHHRIASNGDASEER